MCTRQSREVIKIIWDMFNTLFLTLYLSNLLLLLSCSTHRHDTVHGLSCHSIKFLWKIVNSKPPTIPFGVIACTLSDNLSLHTEKNLSPVDGSPSQPSQLEQNWPLCPITKPTALAQALLTELTRQCQPKCLLWRNVGLARTGDPIVTIAGRLSSQANYSQS